MPKRRLAMGRGGMGTHWQPSPSQAAARWDKSIGNQGAILAPGHWPQPSGMAVVAASPLVSVLLPSTREVMTREMMDCKYPANGSLQPGRGPGTLTGNVSTGLGHAGPRPAGGNSASLAGELHPCTPSLWGDVFSMIPIEQPHGRGCRERGRWKRTIKWEESTEGSCGDTPGPHSPSPAVPRLVVSKMVLVDIFMASLSSSILVSYKEILNNFLGTKVILGSYICMK